MHNFHQRDIVEWMWNFTVSLWTQVDNGKFLYFYGIKLSFIFLWRALAAIKQWSKTSSTVSSRIFGFWTFDSVFKTNKLSFFQIWIKSTFLISWSFYKRCSKNFWGRDVVVSSKIPPLSPSLWATCLTYDCNFIVSAFFSWSHMSLNSFPQKYLRPHKRHIRLTNISSFKKQRTPL